MIFYLASLNLKSDTFIKRDFREIEIKVIS